MKTITKIFILIFIGWLALTTIFYFNKGSKKLEVNFLDVGQGDAILIITPEQQKILIDGGPDDNLINKLGPYFNFGDRTIDLMILTHPHSDHLVGLVEVLERFKVKKVLYNGPAQTTPEYLEWSELITEQQIPQEIPQAGQEYFFSDDIKLKIIYPFNDLTNIEPDDLNENSLVCQLSYGEIDFLFTGDLPQKEEQQILNSGLTIDSEVLKVGHHGSQYSSGEDFIREASPKTAIIQVGVDNKFNHPHLLTLRRYQRQKIQVLRTDLKGTITVFSNGQEYWLNP